MTSVQGASRRPDPAAGEPTDRDERAIEDRKRVLYLHQYFRTPDMGGGTRSYEMARRLVAAGYDVTMMTSDNGARPAAAGVEIEGFDVHWIPVAYDNNMGYLRRILAFLTFSVKSLFASLKVPADLVFATSTPLTICIPALVVQRRKRIPFVFEVRDLWPEVPIAIGALSNPVLVRAARWLERTAYRKADRVVTLSPGMTKGVVDAGVSAKKIVEIPNSCDLDRFFPSDGKSRKIREQHAWLGDRPMLLYAGTLGKVNGVGWLVHVAAALLEIDENVRVVVIGSGLEEKKVRRLAEELGVLDNNFFMIGKVPKTEIVDWFQASTAACSTVIPLKELEANSANKFFDALSSGKPIIINHGGWQKEVIEREAAGLSLEHGDPEGSARIIANLLGDDEECRRLGANARALAERDYSRDACAGRLVRTFGDLLAKR